MTTALPLRSRTVSLGEVVQFERKAIQPDAIESGTHYLGLEHLSGEGNILGPIEVSAGDLASTKFKFSTQHVLYGKLRPYLKKVARPSFSGVCSTDIIPIRPNEELDRDYLYHWLRAPKIVALAEARSSGANLPRISPAIMAEFRIPLPPLCEQRRVAAILDKAEILRQKTQQRSGMVNEVQGAMFRTIVGSRSPQYKSWPEMALAELAQKSPNSIRTGPFGSDLRHSEFEDAGVMVLGIDNAVENRFKYTNNRYISQSKYELLKRYTVYPGDVLITIMGTTGRSAVVPNGIPLAINTKHLACITLDQKLALPEFVSYSIHSEPDLVAQIRQSDKGAIMDGLNLGVIKHLTVRVPPIDTQRTFQTALRRADDILSQALAQRAQCEELSDALINCAFVGDLT